MREIITKLQIQLNDVGEQLNVKSAALQRQEIETDELKRKLDSMLDTLTRERNFYKAECESLQLREDKIKRDIETVENLLKLKNSELEEYRGKMQINERIMTDLREEHAKLKAEFKAKWEMSNRERHQEIRNLKANIFEKDVTIETLQTRNLEIDNENKQMYSYKTKFESTKKELNDCYNEIRRLTEGLKNRDIVISRLEEMAKRNSLSAPPSPSEILLFFKLD